MKNFVCVFLAVSAFMFIIPGAQAYEDEEIIERGNIIMKNIYNGIWRIRDRYPELNNFSPDNCSDTQRLAAPFQSIKSIRIKGQNTTERRFKFFLKEQYITANDIIYICFSLGPVEFANSATPTLRIYKKDLKLYLLLYTNSDNNFLVHDIANIVKENSEIVEPVDY